jgi:transcription antitermination protein NusB
MRPKHGRRPGSPRAAARIAAVQALYQIEMSGAPADEVIAEFRDHRLSGGEQQPAADARLFASLTAAASVRRADIDRLISGALATGWSLERLDSVMRALLRAGVCELLEFADVPARVVIDQYVEVAHAFLAEKETGFVNGVLDRLARTLRPQELGAAGAPDGGKAKR